jgi:hypothetical protein
MPIVVLFIYIYFLYKNKYIDYQKFELISRLLDIIKYNLLKKAISINYFTKKLIKTKEKRAIINFSKSNIKKHPKQTKKGIFE